MSTSEIASVSEPRQRRHRASSSLGALNRAILYLIALLLVTVFMGPFLWTLGSSLEDRSGDRDFPADVCSRRGPDSRTTPTCSRWCRCGCSRATRRR